MPWDKQSTDRLKYYWSQGHSAAQIAAKLGDRRITRNAVIGKIHRLGLSGRVAPVKPRLTINYDRIFYIDDEAIKPSNNVDQHGVVFEVEIEKPSSVIIRPPCWRLRRIAGFLFSVRLNEEIFEPLINDIQFEYVDAVSKNENKKAEWIKIRGYMAFIRAVIGVTYLKLAKDHNGAKKPFSDTS